MLSFILMAFSFKKTVNSINPILKSTQTISSGLPSLDAFLCMCFYSLILTELLNLPIICYKSAKIFTKYLLQDIIVDRYKYIRNS